MNMSNASEPVARLSSATDVCVGIQERDGHMTSLFTCEGTEGRPSVNELRVMLIPLSSLTACIKLELCST